MFYKVFNKLSEFNYFVCEWGKWLFNYLFLIDIDIFSKSFVSNLCGSKVFF